MKEQELLKNLRNDAATEQSIRSGRDERAELEMHISETRLALASYVDRFPILTSYDESEEETEITVKDRLHQIRKNIDRYTRLTENTEELEQEIAAIRRSPEFPKEGLSVEELQNKQTELDDKIAEMNRFIQTDMEEVSNLSESLVSHEEERDHLADEEEEEGENEKDKDSFVVEDEEEEGEDEEEEEEEAPENKEDEYTPGKKRKVD